MIFEWIFKNDNFLILQASVNVGSYRNKITQEG
jgi:hypothetical protein